MSYIHLLEQQGIVYLPLPCRFGVELTKHRRLPRQDIFDSPVFRDENRESQLLGYHMKSKGQLRGIDSDFINPVKQN